MNLPYKQTAKLNIFTAPWSARKILAKDGREYFTHRKQVIYLSMCSPSFVDGFDLQYKQTESAGLIIQRLDVPRATLIIYTYEKR